MVLGFELPQRAHAGGSRLRDVGCAGGRHLWPGVRVPALVLAFVWTVLVGFSRLVLGVHWPTDVMVAVCLGTAIPLAFSLALESRKRHRGHERAGIQADSLHGGR